MQRFEAWILSAGGGGQYTASMDTLRLPNEDFHYVINAFNRSGDPAGIRIQGNSSYFSFDTSAASGFQPGEVTLHLSVHIDRNTPKELVREAIQNIAQNLDAIYEPLEEMRSRWVGGKDLENPIIASEKAVRSSLFGDTEFYGKPMDQD